MLDYYTLLRRSTGLPILPYAVLLYPGRPALGYRTYEEQFRGRTVASLTYFQVSLPSLDARPYAASQTFAVGDLVDHPKFGRGTVVAAAAQRIEVEFDDGKHTLVHAR